MSSGHNSYQLEWTPEDGDVAVSGELAYTCGYFTATATEKNGDKKVSKGKYLNVWKKDEKGHWKLLVDMGNKNPAPGE
jgi:ketosteroid isomerase-like protein